jgi:hypothetical protein
LVDVGISNGDIEMRWVDATQDQGRDSTAERCRGGGLVGVAKERVSAVFATEKANKMSGG